MQAHLDAAVSVIAPGDWQAGYTVVAVAEKLYAQTMIFRREPVEAREEIVQHLYELLGAALTRQSFDEIVMNYHQIKLRDSLSEIIYRRRNKNSARMKHTVSYKEIWEQNAVWFRNEAYTCETLDVSK